MSGSANKGYTPSSLPACRHTGKDKKHNKKQRNIKYLSYL